MEQPPGVLHLLCCTKSCFAHLPISTRSPGPVSLHAERGVERAITDGPQRIAACASSSGKDTRGALWAEGSSFSALRCQQGLRQVLVKTMTPTHVRLRPEAPGRQEHEAARPAALTKARGAGGSGRARCPEPRQPARAKVRG